MVLKGLYMINRLPQFEETLTPNSATPEEAVEYISSYIETHSCEYMSVDISFMNVLDACFVSTLCGTKHFTKYPKGKINWRISSEIVREFNKDLELGNNNYIF